MRLSARIVFPTNVAVFSLPSASLSALSCQGGTDWGFRLQPLAFVGSSRASGLHPGNQGSIPGQGTKASLPAAAAVSKINTVEELVHMCQRGHTQAPVSISKSQKHAVLQSTQSPT